MNGKLIYANADKTKDLEGWTLDFDYLLRIQNEYESKRYDMELEDIEAILLIANGEGDLL